MPGECHQLQNLFAETCIMINEGKDSKEEAILWRSFKVLSLKALRLTDS